MPVAAPKPCNKPGCGNLTNGRYCTDHKQLNSSWNRYHNGKTRHERGYGNKWDKLRKQILQRDEGLCQACYKHGVYTPATAVNHIIPKARGGTDRADNLQAICNTCHKAKTALEGGGG